MNAYLLIGAASAVIIASGYGYAMQKANRNLHLELAASRGELMTCGARLDNLIEDLRSDNAIDNLPDDALRNVPSRWLRPTPGPTAD